jgi:hypothetical protein
MKPGVLTRRHPIRRRARRDPVSPELRRAVLERDGGCVARRLDSLADWCEGRVQLDHVQEGYGRMGKRASSRLDTLASVCAHHHLDGWATANRPLLRQYLALAGGLQNE